MFVLFEFKEVKASLVMTCIGMAYIVMTCIGMAYIVMTNIVMAYIVGAFVVMAHMGMAACWFVEFQAVN